MSSQPQAASGPTTDDAARPAALERSVVLVGLMGAGKSKVGRILAKQLGVGFSDADEAIVTAAGMSIPEIFATHGEQRFRELERRVVARLLDEPPQVIALGGGAFVDPATRSDALAKSLTVWLEADLDTLVARVQRKRGTRPLLEGVDPRARLAELIEQRYPIYALAHARVESGQQPPEEIAQRIAALIRGRAVAS